MRQPKYFQRIGTCDLGSYWSGNGNVIERRYSQATEKVQNFLEEKASHVTQLYDFGHIHGDTHQDPTITLDVYILEGITITATVYGIAENISGPRHDTYYITKSILLASDEKEVKELTERILDLDRELFKLYSENETSRRSKWWGRFWKDKRKRCRDH